MTELCETCRQPLCPWEGERCEVCLLDERNEREKVKADRKKANGRCEVCLLYERNEREEVKDNRKKANGQTPQARDKLDYVRGQASAGGGGVD